MTDDESKKKLVSRLRRVEGQISAICRMVDEDQGVGSYDEPSGSQVGSRDDEIDASPVACP